VGVSLKNKEKTIAIQQACMNTQLMGIDWSVKARKGVNVMHEETKPRIEKEWCSCTVTYA
jgi:hypothetical protein